jgi:hypothetical protein
MALDGGLWVPRGCITGRPSVGRERSPLPLRTPRTPSLRAMWLGRPHRLQHPWRPCDYFGDNGLVRAGEVTPMGTATGNRAHSSSMAKSLIMRTSSPTLVAMRSRNFNEVRNHSAPVRVPRTPSWSASRRKPWNCLSAFKDDSAGYIRNSHGSSGREVTRVWLLARYRASTEECPTFSSVRPVLRSYGYLT